MIQWAPFAAAQAAGALPKYEAPVNLGALNQVNETLNFNEASAYGDNVRKAYVKQFRDGTLAVETLYLSHENAAKISGATLDEENENDLPFNADDTPPYGGLAFFVTKLKDDESGTVYYQGVWYPKVKANIEGDTFQTKGDSITLTNDKLSFAVFACNAGDYKIKSDELATEAEAIAWVNEKIKATT